MKISVWCNKPCDESAKILATVLFRDFSDPGSPPNNTCEVQVFIDHADSYPEIQRRAVVAARDFLQKVLAHEPFETSDR